MSKGFKIFHKTYLCTFVHCTVCISGQYEPVLPSVQLTHYPKLHVVSLTSIQADDPKVRHSVVFSAPKNMATSL